MDGHGTGRERPGIVTSRHAAGPSGKVTEPRQITPPPPPKYQIPKRLFFSRYQKFTPRPLVAPHSIKP